MSWKSLPEIGPRRRCLWGGWRCDEDAVVIQEPRPLKGRPLVLCADHYRAHVAAELEERSRRWHQFPRSTWIKVYVETADD